VPALGANEGGGEFGGVATNGGVEGHYGTRSFFFVLIFLPTTLDLEE
jgi:hypothetical protein